MPRGLTPGQAAELRELLDLIHGGMRSVIEHATVDEKENTVSISFQAWQKLLRTQSDVSVLIRAIEDPQSADHQNQDTGKE